MNGNILIVDDNPINIQLIAGILDAHRYDLEFATGGKDAVEAVEERAFDLILMDIMMPEITGYEACQLIKQHKNGKDIPIIFLTAKTDMDSITQAFAVGGVDYITKPFNSDELLSRVKTHVELHRTRAKLEELVARRTEELRVANLELTRANKELEGLEEAKNEFINIISHEIRTPLNGIMGSLQLMKMDADNNKMNMRMQILDESVNRLETFSSKIILLSELRSGRYKLMPEKVNVNLLIDKILQQCKSAIDEKRLVIFKDVSAKIEIETDAYLLEICIANLLDNSIRLSTENSKIDIKIGHHEETSAIVIQDQAGGINEAMLTKLFKPFSLVEKFVNWNSGVGLYLVKLICEYLSMKVELKNCENGVMASLFFRTEFGWCGVSDCSLGL